jgi:hypothetical protein
MTHDLGSPRPYTVECRELRRHAERVRASEPVNVHRAPSRPSGIGPAVALLCIILIAWAACTWLPAALGF